MARQIKLTFTDSKFVTALLADRIFLEAAEYLNPIKHRDYDTQIIFSDPVPYHSIFATEEVVLSLVGRCIKRIFFKDVKGDIAYNSPFVSMLKGGINFNGEMIVVDTTDVQN